MPNFIKNRIELTGSDEDIKNLLDKFSTPYEQTPSRAFDGELIFIHKKTGEPGWLDEKTGKFKRRNVPDVDSVPEQFTQKFEEAWTRFPDFEKIIPMPPGLKANPHSGITLWIEICTGQVDFLASFDENSMKGLTSSMKRSNAVRALTEGKNITQFSDEELELFIQGVKNFRDTGFISWDFITAWSGVPELIEKMGQEFPQVNIVYKYSDEDTGSNCGIGEYREGKADFTRLENGSKKAYELAFELRPERKEDYRLVGDAYKYAESE